MPIDCEYLLSVSPPIFTARSFKSYPACDPFGSFGQPFAPNRKSKLNYSDLNFYKNGRNKLKNLFPLRSCLIVRSADLTTTLNTENNNNNNNNKKRVVFADDKGFSLTSVKLVREPSDCPPLWDDTFLEQVTRGVQVEASTPTDVWEPDFVQPAANYLRFRNKLESNCVSLENAIVKENDQGDQVISGTVKVKNLEFHKTVSVRASFDQWQSHKDVCCTFVPSSVDPELQNAARHDLYDTFSFSLKLPDHLPHRSGTSRSIEFCAFFVSGDESTGSAREFWDNNEGKNYRFISTETGVSSQKLSKDSTTKFEDALTAELSSWTDFASWQHLINDSPYW